PGFIYERSPSKRMGFFMSHCFILTCLCWATHPVTYLSGTKVEIEGVCRAELITGLGQSRSLYNGTKPLQEPNSKELDILS
ncbi:hypothetical protein, partial [Methylophaga thalassica]|uniref:hypothetical protein n=1 Tax=Methylophaga aminisulfidivorans TaxID=230105 RepID=UPI0023547A97